jgi:hypothetical protein
MTIITLVDNYDTVLPLFFLVNIIGQYFFFFKKNKNKNSSTQYREMVGARAAIMIYGTVLDDRLKCVRKTGINNLFGKA